jgi:hypothetical protein
MSANIAKRLGVIIVALASLGVAYAVTSSYVTLHNTGTVKGIGVGVYWDSGCTQQVTSIDWGLTDPGAVKNVTVYIRNEGNAPITLSLQTANWNPSNGPNYISLTWDYAGQTIGVNQAIAVVLSLSIASNVESIAAFSFDIIISAVG